MAIMSFGGGAIIEVLNTTLKLSNDQKARVIQDKIPLIIK